MCLEDILYAKINWKWEMKNETKSKWKYNRDLKNDYMQIYINNNDRGAVRELNN